MSTIDENDFPKYFKIQKLTTSIYFEAWFLDCKFIYVSKIKIEMHQALKLNTFLPLSVRQESCN